MDDVRADETEERTVRFVGGPWDGAVVDGMDPVGPEAPEDGGGYMVVDGQALRAHYAPSSGEDPDTWHYRGLVDV